MTEKWCVKILLPLKYNDSTNIEPFKFNRVREELLKKFGGFTIHPFSLEGGWINQEDEMKYFDRTKLWEITMDESEQNKTWLEKYKKKLKERFKQHQIYMVVYTVMQI